MHTTCLFAAAAIAISASNTVAQWTVVDLHPPGTDGSYIHCASEGQQGGSFQVGGSYEACFWRGSTASWTSLSSDPTFESYVAGFNGAVQVGNSAGTGGPEPFLWRGEASSMTSAMPSGGLFGGTFGAAAGSMVGWIYFGGDTYHAGTWTIDGGAWTDLHPAGVETSFAYAITAGQQVGMTYTAELGRACLWSGTADSWIDLHPSGANYSAVYATDGEQQGGDAYFASNPHGGLWRGTAESWVDLHPQGAWTSTVSGVGQGMQVGCVEFPLGTRAVVWHGTASSWFDLGSVLPAEWRAQDSFATCITSDAYFTYVGGHAVLQLDYPRNHAMLWIKPRGNLACSPADIGGPGGEPGGDGLLDNNDFIVYIRAFFDRSPGADRGVAGGGFGHDGFLDNNDFIAFINLFFNGCP